MFIPDGLMRIRAARFRGIEETQPSGLSEKLLVQPFQDNLIATMDHAADGAVTARGKPRAVFILLFSTTWLMALVAGWVIPRFSGAESAGAKMMDRIRFSTGTLQQWDMFKTIPGLRGYQMELIGETTGGRRRTFGPIVPELEAFDCRREVRYTYALNRIIDDRHEFLDGYVAQAAGALRGLDPEVERFSIHTTSRITRSLEHSRKDGNLWTTVEQQFGPYPVNDD
jgi:hypothetical protein